MILKLFQKECILDSNKIKDKILNFFYKKYISNLNKIKYMVLKLFQKIYILFKISKRCK